MNDFPSSFEQRILFRLTRASNLLNSVSAAQLKRASEINLMQWRILMLLDRAPGRTITALSAAPGWDKSLVSKNIRKLTEAKLIKACPSSDDGRQVLIYPTEAGTALYRQILPIMNEWHQGIDGVLDENEKRSLLDILSKLESFAAERQKPS